MNGVKRADLRLHPRLVAVDLDGTFLDEHSAVSEASRRAAEEIMARGIEFVVTSGRAGLAFPRRKSWRSGMPTTTAPCFGLPACP